MEKALVFSQEQKSLIWSRFVGPNGGTQEEARHFVEVCETFGLNPLLGDIVFQKYETKQGARTNFITTCDGLLRIAAQHPDYIGAPCAAEVREGDEFEFIPSEGNVRHVFGQKRGNIIGAYAVLYHKRFRPCAVFVNFQEYFKANARSQRKNGRGGSPIWDAMPTAMIVKIAEVFVLRRQFPLGGLYTAEEMGLEEFKSEQVDIVPNPKKSPENNKPGLAQPSHQHKPRDERSADEEPQSSPKEDNQLNPAGNTDSKGFILKQYDSGVSPSGIPYAKLHVVDQESKEEKLVLAKGEESVELIRQIPEEETFLMDVREENGYLFLESVNNVEAGAVS
ncbi:RecT family recombinase [Domibacillus robiginosus]|uniref:RecT family recombinase n=1 Tax=Domibacillus robiginosus TaxID=1071054 RepID=UPI00067E2533|nr:RecT family recombinase [Domibacillus robiginosus]